MFPFELEDDELDIDLVDDSEPVFTDYEIDFTNNCLTGNKVFDLDCIVQWARLALNTERYAFYQYSWQFGSEISSLFGRSYKSDYIQTELEKFINDCLIVDGSGIDSVDNVSYDFVDGILSFSFYINTRFGGEFIHV